MAGNLLIKEKTMSNNTLILTDEETQIMISGMNSDYENFLTGPTYLGDVLDGSGLEMEVAVETVGGLVSKEMVVVRGSGNRRNIQATELGKSLCIDF